MLINIISEKKIVKEFISEVAEIINDVNFDIGTNFYLNYKFAKDAQYSTTTAMAELEFGIMDIVNLIKELTIKDYSHTLIDNDKRYDGEMLHVFGKMANDKLLYIKLKIRKGERIVVCISFHFAENELGFPYLKM